MDDESTQLRGWKEIARHINASERSAKRWEGTRGLPIHRVPGRSRDAVYSRSNELDAWLQGGGARAPKSRELDSDDAGELTLAVSEDSAADTARPRSTSSTRFALIAAALLFVLVIAAAMWLGAPLGGNRSEAASQAPATQTAAANQLTPPKAIERQLRIRRPGGAAHGIGLVDGSCGGFGAGSGRWVQLCTRPGQSMLQVDIRVLASPWLESTQAPGPSTNVALMPDSEVLVMEPLRFYVEWVTAPASGDPGARGETRPD